MSDFPPRCSISHLLLAGAAGWALKTCPVEFNIVIGSFGLLLTHGIMGVVTHTSASDSKNTQTVYKQIALLADCFPVPLLNAQLYYTADYRNLVPILHVVSAFIPVITQFCFDEGDDTNEYIIDALLGCHLISLFHFFWKHDLGTWTGGLVFVLALNRYCFWRLAPDYNAPRADVSSLGHIFYTIFAIGSLIDNC